MRVQIKFEYKNRFILRDIEEQTKGNRIKMAAYLKMIPRVTRAMTRIDKAYKAFGGRAYAISEPTSITEHSVITARVMQCHICPGDNAVTAALLHDFGHVARCKPIDPKNGVDDRHQWVAVSELKKLGFPPEVYMPIGLHVKAKQYLASVNANYYGSLTEGSKLSLGLQGGMMSKQSRRAFEKNKWFDSAILLRMADDNGKDDRITNATDIMEFADTIERVLIQQFSQPGWIPKKPLGCTLH